MLYKKYHRNFVKQFKKGAEFKLKRDSNYIRTRAVITEPFIELNFTIRKPYIIVEVTEDTVVCLVHYSGRFNSNIIVEDAIQEIS